MASYVHKNIEMINKTAWEITWTTKLKSNCWHYLNSKSIFWPSLFPRLARFFLMLFGLPLYRINFGLDAVNTACQTSQTGICLFQTFKYSGNRCLTLGQGGSPGGCCLAGVGCVVFRPRGWAAGTAASITAWGSLATAIFCPRYCVIKPSGFHHLKELNQPKIYFSASSSRSKISYFPLLFSCARWVI